MANLKHKKIIACAAVIKEVQSLLPLGETAEAVDFSLHRNPDKLRKALQEAINRTCPKVDTIILGYGLCSLAVVGLTAKACTLVVPRVDDCIALFLGSSETYRKQSEKEPGTYYLTKGWIQVGHTPLDKYRRLLERYTRERADRVMKIMFKNYTRLAYIDTGQTEQGKYRECAQLNAKALNLRYEEIAGDISLIRKMIYGPWDSGFVVARPGQKITLEDFRRGENKTGHLNIPETEM